jgi:ABC-type uncharacterized transport system involved in gliding motility auxiliary subunit
MKRSSLKRYAYIGLILAIVALISTIFFGLIKGIQALGLFTPQNPDTWNLGLYISAGAIVIGLAIYTLLDPDSVRRFLTGRQARYGSNALVMSLAVIGILIVVNLWVYQNPQQWDLTEGKEHTLAPETVSALEALPQNVMAYAFYSSQANPTTAQQLLSDIKAGSNGKFDYEFINPDTDPSLRAQAMGVTGDAKIVLVMGDQKEIVSTASEQEITKALIRLVNPEQRTVYFLTGEGERDIQQAGDQSLTSLDSTLKNKGYTVKTLNLLAENQVPDDAQAIIIAGPQQPLSANEVKLLQDYVDKGGSLVVMEDPLPLTQFGNKPDPLAAYLSLAWGIGLDNDIVVDPHVDPVSHAVSYAYGQHPITQKMNNIGSFFPFSRSLQVVGQIDGVTATPLVLTIDRAWGETNFEGLQNGKLQFDEGQDIPGPITLAIAAENSNTKGRVVVFGTSQFPTDQFFNSGYGNADLIVNTIDWAAEQESLINLTPKQPITRTFTPMNSMELITSLLGAVCLIPLLVLIAGIASWVARRRRG